MSLFIFRSVSVYIKLAALSERFSELSKFVALPNFFFFFFGKGFFYKHTQAVAVLLQRKHCLRFVYGQKVCCQW